MMCNETISVNGSEIMLRHDCNVYNNGYQPVDMKFSDIHPVNALFNVHTIRSTQPPRRTCKLLNTKTKLTNNQVTSTPLIIRTVHEQAVTRNCPTKFRTAARRVRTDCSLRNFTTNKLSNIVKHHNQAQEYAARPNGP